MVGLHYPEAAAGMMFYQSTTPLGVAIPIYTATAATGGSLPIFNPPDSGVNVEIVSYDLDYASGTAEYGAIGVMGLPLSAVAAGQLCTAFAQTDPVNARGLDTVASKVKSSNAGTVTVTAGVATRPSAAAPGWMRALASINLEAITGTAHGTGMATYSFNGTLIVPPGFMIYLAATRGSVSLVASTVVWKEISLTR